MEAIPMQTTIAVSLTPRASVLCLGWPVSYHSRWTQNAVEWGHPMVWGGVCGNCDHKAFEQMPFLDGDYHVTLLWSGNNIKGGGSEADIEGCSLSLQNPKGLFPHPYLSGWDPSCSRQWNTAVYWGGDMLHTA